MELKFTREQLDFTQVEVRAEFIKNTPSDTYSGLTIGGALTIVEVEQGESMIVKRLNEKDWWECIEYGENGYAQGDWVER